MDAHQFTKLLDKLDKISKEHHEVATLIASAIHRLADAVCEVAGATKRAKPKS
jgi:hypothetical protein